MGTKSSATDMVTEMDRAAEALVAIAARARPDDGVLGEEGAARPARAGVRWFVDPLDGTTNYLYGHPGFAVSVAAEVDGEGWPAWSPTRSHDEVFTAVRGGGRDCNGRAHRAAAGPTWPPPWCATGFCYDRRPRARQAAVLAAVLPRSRDIRRARRGRASTCARWPAGRVDAYYERGLRPWDFAAGGLVADEAGATVGDLDGARRPARLTVAAPPAPASTALLRELVREPAETDMPDKLREQPWEPAS